MVHKLSSGQEAGAKRSRGRPRGFDPDAILERARNVFWNTGYSATSLDELAAATGLNRPSLYGAFGDKQALYLAALEKSRAESVRGLIAALAPEETLRESLERLFAAAAQIYLRGDAGQRGCFLIGTAVTEAVADAEIRHVLSLALNELDTAFEERLRRAQEAGELDADADISALAKVATATLNGMAIRARAGADADELAQFGRGLVTLICGAYSK
ncbi:TetR/AcrR family transcriptional regulator [Corticibacterium sp. UT-5YL-CI-8]|nr:TetR/AcrR family transcriptional regulator [Tianweitania sp. UT-5YL-CI-8]